MVILFVFSFLLIPLSASSLNCTCKTGGVSPRIVSGHEVGDHKYPWIVSLSYPIIKYAHYCGATIVNENWVVTAGHCMRDSVADQIVLTFGTNEVGDPNALRIRGEEIIVHEGFVDAPEYINDIALIKLKEPIKFNQNIQPACLPGPAYEDYEKLTAAGWGRIEPCGKPVKNLIEAEFDYVNFDECLKRWTDGTPDNRHPVCKKPGEFMDDEIWESFNIRKDHVCIISDKANVCMGDSGSPLMSTKSDKTYVVGLTSTGYSCQARYRPSTYVRISEHINWINKHVGQTCSQ